MAANIGELIQGEQGSFPSFAAWTASSKAKVQGCTLGDCFCLFFSEMDFLLQCFMV